MVRMFSADYGWGGLGAITMLTGKKNNHFELNAGGFLGFEDTYNYAFIFPIFKCRLSLSETRGRIYIQGQMQELYL